MGDGQIFLYTSAPLFCIPIGLISAGSTSMDRTFYEDDNHAGFCDVSILRQPTPPPSPREKLTNSARMTGPASTSPMGGIGE
jgi:hypothetical protein